MMAPYIASRILAGAMDYKAVVSLYPQYKKDIDEILILEGREDLIVPLDD